jgi:hypothetical protein
MSSDLVEKSVVSDMKAFHRGISSHSQNASVMVPSIERRITDTFREVSLLGAEISMEYEPEQG